MPERVNRPGNRLMDRPEYQLKQQPLTCLPKTSVLDAVMKMTEKNAMPGDNGVDKGIESDEIPF